MTYIHGLCFIALLAKLLAFYLFLSFSTSVILNLELDPLMANTNKEGTSGTKDEISPQNNFQILLTFILCPLLILFISGYSVHGSIGARKLFFGLNRKYVFGLILITFLMGALPIVMNIWSLKLAVVVLFGLGILQILYICWMYFTLRVILDVIKFGLKPSNELKQDYFNKMVKAVENNRVVLIFSTPQILMNALTQLELSGELLKKLKSKFMVFNDNRFRFEESNLFVKLLLEQDILDCEHFTSRQSLEDMFYREIDTQHFCRYLVDHSGGCFVFAFLYSETELNTIPDLYSINELVEQPKYTPVWVSLVQFLSYFVRR